MTPQQAADAALAAIDPTTTVTTDGTADGRRAVRLRTGADARRTTASLVGQVRIAIDAEQHIPLRVQVFAKGAADAGVRGRLHPDQLRRPGRRAVPVLPAARAPPSPIRPRQGERDRGAGRRPARRRPTPPAAPTSPPSSAPAGRRCWWHAGRRSRSGPAAPATRADTDRAGAGRCVRTRSGCVVDRSLPQVSGDWGSGRLLQSALFSVLLTDDGRMIAGAVAPEQLYLAAAPVTSPTAAVNSAADR